MLFLSSVFSLTGCANKVVDPIENNTFDAVIEELAEKYIKVGGMVGIIDSNQKRAVFSFGSKSVQFESAPDTNTVFDIGSITKTFTALLAAQKYLSGEIQDDTVAHYLPVDKVTMPTKEGVKILFLHLLTHSSGLPRTPHESGSTFPRPAGFNSENPYAAYTADDVYDYLTNYCTLVFTPGTWWEYSNTGFGLLGHIIGLVDGTSYSTVLKRDIFDVIGMDNSSLFMSQKQVANQAFGHDANFNVVPFYTANDIFQGAGMIKSSLHDLFLYLEAYMGLRETPLRNAMDLTLQPIMHQGSMGDQALAWWILELEDGQTIVYSAGGTNGHSSFMGFNPETLTGTIVLSNSNMHDGGSIEMGKEIMKAIIKY